ncbi:hypothetical protein [Bacillus altitudinis]|uniref:hypothetical protein n=1 Tax=Bacillus altitudinis TaxID=293387 RepID=UPI00064C555C|nr:hypothetical protein [Bacillus altitudinis]KLV15366.1 hypothetical protein ABW03_18890 [Bacillus altitudinis]
MGGVKRVFPEAVNCLSNWIEQNFHEIDSYVTTFKMKDGTLKTIYLNESYLEAIGMVEIAKESLLQSAKDDEFVTK